MGIGEKQKEIISKLRRDILHLEGFRPESANQSLRLGFARLLIVEGKVVHIVAKHCFDLSRFLRQLKGKSSTEDASRQREVFHKGRNFK